MSASAADNGVLLSSTPVAPAAGANDPGCRCPVITSDGVQDAHIIGAQPQFPHFRPLYSRSGALIEQANPEDVLTERLDEMETELEPQRSLTVDSENEPSRKHEEEAPAQLVQADDAAHDVPTVRRNLQSNSGGESGPGINSGRYHDFMARRDQWFPIGLAISVLCYYLGVGSWPESKAVLTCAAAAITLKIWAARKDRKKPTIASGAEELHPKPQCAANHDAA